MAKTKRWFRSGLVAGAVLFGGFALVMTQQGAREGGGGSLLTTTWSLHQIVVGASGSGQPDGADGIDMVDIDGDGLLDAVSGHEQGLRLTVSFNPGTDDAAVEDPWPTVTLPNGVNMCSVEDAIACDVDADGALDIVAACETGAQRVEVMFAPAPPNTRTELLTAANWTRVTLDASVNRRSMRVACADMEGDDSLELVVGEKDAGVASFLGYYVSETPRTGASWTHVDVVPVGWVMQMFVTDFDGDTDLDIVYSDKEDIATGTPDVTKRGVRWLESDGLDPPGFTEWPISAVEGQWKWFDIVDFDSDTDLDVVACRSEPPSVNEQALFTNGDGGTSWTETSIPLPAGTGTCQHTTAVDIDLDGVLDIGTSYSQSSALQGMTWQKQTAPGVFSTGRLSGVLSATDTKFDNLAWVDVDADGDLDAVTSEQHIPAGTGPGLGVVYFENPRNTFVPTVAPPAVNCSALTSGTAGGGTSATTASISPAANAAIYVAVQTALAAGPAAPTSVIGNGITYTQEETVQFHTSNTRRLTVLRGMSATPSAGTIAISYGATSQTSYIWSVIQCTGVDTGGTNASSATVQSTTNTASASTSINGTLAALAAASSVHLAFSGISINGNQSPDADFVELTDNANATGVGGLEAEWATNQTTVTPTFSSANAGVISLEVKIAP